MVKEKANNEFGTLVAADESCRSPEDAMRIAKGSLADVINIKLAKLGVLGALKVVQIARENNLQLMIGGMVESRLGMGFSASFAAAIGDFRCGHVFLFLFLYFL